MTEQKKTRKKSTKKLIEQLNKTLGEMGWDMHIPVKTDGDIIPYAIIGRPVFSHIIKNYLDEAGVNKALVATLDIQTLLKKQS